MNLFVDDERPAPLGWYHAKTAVEAIRVLDLMYYSGSPVAKLSLDHDLGIDPATGDDLTTRTVVQWLIEHEYWPLEVYVHTGNPVAEEWLVGTIRRYAPPGTLKGYGLNYWGTGPDSVIRNDA